MPCDPQTPREATVKFKIATDPIYFGYTDETKTIRNTETDNWKCALKTSGGSGPAVYVALTVVAKELEAEMGAKGTAPLLCFHCLRGCKTLPLPCAFTAFLLYLYVVKDPASLLCFRCLSTWIILLSRLEPAESKRKDLFG